MRPFWIALQFLTRLPVRLDRVPDAQAIGRSLPFYPLVGLLLGAVLATLAWRLADQPPLLTAALVLVAWVALIGDVLVLLAGAARMAVWRFIGWTLLGKCSRYALVALAVERL